MRAVVMAGGEGTRLRPMTANAPKPLLPVAGRPIMEHVLRLLRRHGFDETVVTVQYLASLVRTHFGDGEELGMHLSYATEGRPLGTAGSVKNAESALRDDAFVVLSGDALTDVDLTALVAAHRARGALVTACLARVPDPLEFGIVVTDDEQRVERFLEKPTWGEVFTDTVNTGIYVMEPEVFDAVAPGERVDWAADVFPALIARGAPVHGWVAGGYWEDVGTQESYLRAQADVLDRRVEVEMPGTEVSPGVWLGEGAEVDPSAELRGPLCLGDFAKVEAGASLGPYTVLGKNVLVRSGAVLERAVVHDNALVGAQVGLRGCVIGKGTDVLRGAHVEEGAVVADGCVVEEEAVLSPGVLVFPAKTIEAGAVVHDSVVWASRGSTALFGRRGVSGLVNVEMTPEHLVRLATAFATTLPRGSTVTTCRDAGRAAASLERAVVAALTTSGVGVRELGVMPLPVARFDTAAGPAAGGVVLRTTPGDPQSLDVLLLGPDGADLSPQDRRRLERVFARQEFRRAAPGDVAEVSAPDGLVEAYVAHVRGAVDTCGVEGAGLRVVLDSAGGAAGLVLPALLGGLGVDVLAVEDAPRDGQHPRERPTTESPAEHLAALDRLGHLVREAEAAFGVRFDHVGERFSLVDERGEVVEDDRALLVVLDLVAAEQRHGRIALPVSTTRVAEQVTRFHGCGILWTRTGAVDLRDAGGDGRADDVVFAGDGAGGFVVPEVGGAVDGLATLVRLVGLVARTRLTLSRIDARIPRAHVVRRTVPTPWARKGAVMREVLEAAGGREVDTVDGLRVVEPDGGGWALVLPDPAEAVTHLWAEAADPGGAERLLAAWSAVVGGAPGR